MKKKGAIYTVIACYAIKFLSKILDRFALVELLSALWKAQKELKEPS